MFDYMINKIIALDVDGTLVSWENLHRLDAETIQLLNELNANGHHIVLTTGRSLSHIYPIIEPLNFRPKWVVGANGATVFSLQDEEYVLFTEETFFIEELLGYWLERMPDAKFAIETADEGFRHSSGFTLDGVPIEIGWTVSAEELLQASPAIRLILAEATLTEEEAYKLINEVPFDITGYIHTINGKTWFEIMSPRASKKEGLQTVQKELGVSSSDIIAFGDGHNDFSMLEWVSQEGYSVAMGNSVPELKMVSTVVTSDVLDRGVYKILNTMIEEGKL